MKRKATKKKKNQSVKILSLVAAIIFVIVLLYVFVKPESSENKTNSTMNYTNCQNYRLAGGTSKALETNNTYELNECSNAPGFLLGGYYGLTQAIWTIQNPNNVSLKIPCNIIAVKTNFTSRTVLDEKSVKELKVDVPADGSVILNENFSLPKCYSSFRMECNPVYTLPECE